jgi:hydrogenase-4 component F
VILELLTPSGLVALVPLLAAALLAQVRNAGIAAWANIAASTAAFALACALPWSLGAGELLLVDRLAAHMAILTSFVAMTTAWFSRFYIALVQAFLGFMLLALLSNNLGVTWVSVEAATIAAVLVVGLPRTANAIEASWKFFIICSVGIALALFGTIVLYLAAQPALGPGLPAMSWSSLAVAAPRFKGPLLNLAFVFMLIGYGTKAGLAPLHAWMPDAHAEGPTPVSAVLAGSILNVALVVIWRLHALLASNPEAIAPGPPILAFGVLTMLLATFALWRRRDVKRFFAFSTVEHSGVAALAIGLGGRTAMFAALLHITVHTLVKSAVFQCVGRACQLKGGQLFTDIGGLLTARHRALGLTLACGMVAIAGLPPFGLFSSEFLIVTELTRRLPWLVLPVGLAFVVGAWALFWRLSTLCLGTFTPDRGPAPSMLTLGPAWLHLALAAILGFAMPEAVANWFGAIAGAAP